MKKAIQVTTHDFLIYKDNDNDVKVNVLLINKDIWLTQDLIAELFGVARSTITDHINNILNSGELKTSFALPHLRTDLLISTTLSAKSLTIPKSWETIAIAI